MFCKSHMIFKYLTSYANSVLVSHYNFKTTNTGPSLWRACVLLLGIMRCSSTKVNGKKWQSISTTHINFWKHNCMSVPDSNMPSIRLLLIYTSIRNLSHLHSITRLNDCSVFVSTQPRQRKIRLLVLRWTHSLRRPQAQPWHRSSFCGSKPLSLC